MMSSAPLPQAFVFLSCFLTFVNTAYYIDDANSTVRYGGSWDTAVTNSSGYRDVNSSQLYNGTFHVNNEIIGDTIDIPFTGSGITVYVITLLVYDVYKAVAASLDGGEFMPPLPEVRDCNPVPVVGVVCPTIRAFDIQGYYSHIPHTLHIVCMDLDRVAFDYAIVNETALIPLEPDALPTGNSRQNSTALPTGTSLQNSTAIPTGNNSQTSTSKTNTGVIVGAAVGGVLVIVVIVISIILCRRRTARNSIAVDPEPKAMLVDPGYVTELPTTTNLIVASPAVSSPTDVSQGSLGRSSRAAPYQQSPLSLDAEGYTLSSPVITASSPELLARESGRPRSPATLTAIGAGLNTSSSTPAPEIVECHAPHPEISSQPDANQLQTNQGTTIDSNGLTNAETAFVHSLFNLDVPAPAVANVISRMINERGTGAASRSIATAPPDYDFKHS